LPIPTNSKTHTIHYELTEMRRGYPNALIISVKSTLNQVIINDLKINIQK